MTKIITKCCLIFATLIAASFAQASDYHSPRTAGLGGAGHAGPLLNDSIYLNPSFVSFMKTYTVSANFEKYNGDQIGTIDQHGRVFNVSLQDSRTELFQAGVGYTAREDASFIHVGAAKRAIETLGFGLGGKMAFYDDGTITDLTFSTTFIPIMWFQSALIIDNLIQSDRALAHGLLREVTLGMKFNIMQLLMIYVDPHYTGQFSDGRSLGHQIAAEIPFFTDFFVRIGQFRNSKIPYLNDRGTGFGLGIGWIGPRISFDYGFTRVNTSFNNLPTSYSHNFGVTIYF